MKRIALVSIIAILISCFLGSCLIVSLHPLGNESQQIWKPELVGVWEGDQAGIPTKFIITRHPKPKAGDYLIKRVEKLGDFGNSEFFEEYEHPDSLMQFLQENKDLVGKAMETLSDSDYATMFSTFDEEGNRQINEQMGSRALFSEVILPGDTTLFAANLFKVGDHYFLDLFGQGTEKLFQNFIPVHTFFKIDLESNQAFSLSEFKSNKLKTLFEENRIRLPHQITPDGTTLITAESHKIQEFVKKYTEDPEVFEMPSQFTKTR